MYLITLSCILLLAKAIIGLIASDSTVEHKYLLAVPSFHTVKSCEIRIYRTR